MDVLFDGPVTLTPGATFEKVAYNSGTTYTVNRTTPLGALAVAANTAGFTYDVTDSNYGASGALLLDNIDTYLYQKTPRKAWYAYVNDVYKDGYNNAAGGLNLIELSDGDKVEFYYVDGAVADKTNLAAVKAECVRRSEDGCRDPDRPVMDVLFDGPVTLTPGATFEKVAYNYRYDLHSKPDYAAGSTCVAANTAGFTYDVTDSNYGASGALLLDNIDTYLYQKYAQESLVCLCQ